MKIQTLQSLVIALCITNALWGGVDILVKNGLDYDTKIYIKSATAPSLQLNRNGQLQLRDVDTKTRIFYEIVDNGAMVKREVSAGELKLALSRYVLTIPPIQPGSSRD